MPLHENNLPFINDGRPVPVVEISTGLSLSVIVGVLVVTVIASLRSPAGRAQQAIAVARRCATNYLDPAYTIDPAERERIFDELDERMGEIIAFGPRYRQVVRDEDELMSLLRRAQEKREVASGA